MITRQARSRVGESSKTGAGQTDTTWHHVKGPYYHKLPDSLQKTIENYSRIPIGLPNAAQNIGIHGCMVEAMHGRLEKDALVNLERRIRFRIQAFDTAKGVICQLGLEDFWPETYGVAGKALRKTFPTAEKLVMREPTSGKEK